MPSEQLFLRAYKFVILIALVCVLAIAGIAFAQSGDTLQSILSSGSVPTVMKLGDLRQGWFRFQSSEESEGGLYAQYYGSLVGNNTYYTQGKTLSIGSETYLVAYRAQTKSLDIAELMRSYERPPTVDKLTTETPIALCMLNVRTVGSIRDIKPLDLSTEVSEAADKSTQVAGIFGQYNDERSSLVSESNLKDLGKVVLLYAQQRHSVLPPLQTVQAAKKALYPLAKTDDLFMLPRTKQPYVPNPLLSNRNIASIPDKADMIVYYEPDASPEGLRSVLFLDGHTSRVTQSSWNQLKLISKIH